MKKFKFTQKNQKADSVLGKRLPFSNVLYTVCPESSDLFYKITYFLK